MTERRHLALPAHIERYLGEIAHRWNFSNREYDVTIVLTKFSPEREDDTYCTRRMSLCRLVMSDRQFIRWELVFGAYNRYNQDVIASFLIDFSEHILSSGKALLRGEVVRLGRVLIENATVSAVYCTEPVLFDERLAVFKETDPPTVFVWLVAVTESEACFIKSNGWSRFDRVLDEEAAPDFWDLERKSIVSAMPRKGRVSFGCPKGYNE